MYKLTRRLEEIYIKRLRYTYTRIPYRKVTYEAITRVCQTTYEAILPDRSHWVHICDTLIGSAIVLTN